MHAIKIMHLKKNGQVDPTKSNASKFEEHRWTFPADIGRCGTILGMSRALRDHPWNVHNIIGTFPGGSCNVMCQRGFNPQVAMSTLFRKICTLATRYVKFCIFCPLINVNYAVKIIKYIDFNFQFTDFTEHPLNKPIGWSLKK